MQYYTNILINDYLIILICLFLSLFIGLLIFSLSFFIAIQNPDSEKISAYECGFEPFEDARNKFDVRFYIIAILFIIFDIEVIYLFPWAVSLYATGFFGFWIMILFLLILTVGFLYEVVKKALDWQ
jgi:NADH-quinone oxidoreductase subunit A